MKAMVLEKVSSVEERPLRLVDLPDPAHGEGQVLVKVSACGVCHTEIDEIEGRVSPSRLPMILRHEVVGRVESTGSGVRRFGEGDRVGIGWINWPVAVAPSVSEARRTCVR